jgi:hypothetical protein
MLKKILFILGLLLLLIGVGWIVKNKLIKGSSQNQAILRIDSAPIAAVVLDDQDIGKTPYEGQLTPGEYSIKLVPETSGEELIPWEGSVKILPNLLTYVNRDFGPSEITSGGEILTLEKISSKKSELAVTSIPDKITVSLDKAEKGVTPLLLKDFDPGNYELSVASSNYKDRTVKIKLTSGYKLNASFQLATLEEASPSGKPQSSVSPSATPKNQPSPKSSPTSKASPSPVSASPKSSPKTSPTTNKSTPPPTPYIEVLDTPTNYLNVRQDSSSSSEILTRINPGEMYPLLEENSSGTWYKIEYETGKEGWVSAQYAKKFE